MSSPPSPLAELPPALQLRTRFAGLPAAGGVAVAVVVVVAVVDDDDDNDGGAAAGEGEEEEEEEEELGGKSVLLFLSLRAALRAAKTAFPLDMTDLEERGRTTPGSRSTAQALVKPASLSVSL